MDFALSEEQELLQETVRGFVQNECPPQRVREIFDGDTGTDPVLWNGLMEMGLGGLLVPEAFGGAELELLDLALVMEELGRGAVPGPFLAHSLATLAIVHGGSAAQRERWLPALATGECLGTVALGEAGDAWEPEAWTVVAKDGRVTGTKTFVPAGDAADLYVVGTRGGGLVIVEAGEAGEGVSTEVQDGIDRTRRMTTLVLDDAPCEPLEAGSAESVSKKLRDAALVLIAADAFGAGFALVRMSVDYALTREQFGMPIGQFQGVKHQLANMALDVDPTRSLVWYAAHAFDHLPDEAERAAALAKAHITDRVMAVAREAVEIHGGLGFTWECDVQIWFKRAMWNRTFLGTPEAHRERIAQLGGY